MPERTISVPSSRVEEWKAEGKNREVLTVTQPADGIYLLLRQLREGSPLAEETLKLLQWNGGGFRTRAAFANGHWYGSDPGCYLTEEEISTPLPEIK